MSNPELLTDWEFLKDWKLLFQLNDLEKNSEVMILPTWNSFNSFFNTFKNFSEKEKKYYMELLEHSDEILHEYGGDPLNHIWSDFRPLRLSREEDWSDWLAFFIKESTGKFVFHLFNFNKLLFSIEREFIADSSRADIVIEWGDKTEGTHIEIKIGDPNLSKTHSTSMDIRNSKPHVKHWFDFIILLDKQETDWKKVDELNKEKKIEILYRTWSDVAVALRKCLYEKSENLLWRSLAYTFAGCIEIKLNNSISIEKIKSEHLILSIYNQIDVLERSLKNGKND
jgi:hypothetical protein